MCKALFEVFFPDIQAAALNADSKGGCTIRVSHAAQVVPIVTFTYCPAAVRLPRQHAPLAAWIELLRMARITEEAYLDRLTS